MQVVLYFCEVKKRNIDFRSTCPISSALDIFGDKWSLLVVRDLMFEEKKTYGEFLESEEKIATNILADRLMQLETGGIISREKHHESKAKVLYKLTETGIDLVPALIEEKPLKHWIDNFYGYGSWHARSWFIGHEESGGDVPEEVAEKINYFYKVHAPTNATLCDIRELYRQVAVRRDEPKAGMFTNR